MDLKIDYNEQMLNYYPEVIKAVREFQKLIETQALEIEELHDELAKILGNAYLTTADEARLSEWEKFLGIIPLPQGDDSLETWLEDRRETILARMYKTEKLNSDAISNIVKIFTGGIAQSYFKDGTIYVLIYPPKNNKAYKFENVEQELRKKIPAHLLFQVDRSYNTWAKVAEGNTWKDINESFVNWDEVLLYTPLWELKMR